MVQPASAEWKTAIQKPLRYQGRFELLLQIVPPDMLEGAVASSLDTDPLASVDEVLTLQKAYLPVATFEKDRWKANGAWYLPSTINELIEWWSDVVSGVDGVFTTPIKVELNFDDYYDLLGFTVLFDENSDSYARDFTVTGYTIGGAVSNQIVVQNNTEVRRYVQTEVLGIDRLEVEITKWSKPYHRARIQEIALGLAFYVDTTDVTSVSQLQSGSVLSSKLPVQELSFSYNNIDIDFDPNLEQGISLYLAQRQIVSYRWGFDVVPGDTQWLPTQKAYLDSWTVPSDSFEMEFTATSRLAFLNKPFTRGTYTGLLRSFYDIAEYILLNSDTIIEAGYPTPWELPSTLQNYYTRAPIPTMPTNQLLQLIANATCHVLDTNPTNGFIRFRKWEEGNFVADYTITPNQQEGEPKLEIDTALMSILIGVTNYIQESALSTLHEAEYTLQGEVTIQVQLNSFANTLSAIVTGATILSSTFFARSAILVLQAPVSPTLVNVEITGYKIEEQMSEIETYRNLTLKDGEALEVHNPLTTETEYLPELNEFHRSIAQPRQRLMFKYLGYPELEMFDIIQVETKFGTKYHVINEHQLDFIGGFSGRMVTREQGVE